MPDARRISYAARLNAFAVGAKGGGAGRNKTTICDLIARAGTVGGLTAVDLNYPDHLAGCAPAQIRAAMDEHGMALNGFAMRYYTDPAFRLGAFTNPDRDVRRTAIDLTRRGIDTLAAMGGSLMTLWLGQDGFDYAFQADYRAMWDDTVNAIAEVADHNPGVTVSIEYKPNEPRAYALMPDIGTTLLAISQAGRPNLGVTLDFAHILYADEMPANAAYLAHRHARICGVHLNDGYGRRDDGLMAGTVHPVQTLELLVELERAGYEGVIYFDTFPDHGGVDPVAEARTNIAIVERLRTIAAGLAGNADLAAAIARQDAALSQRIVAAALFGTD